MTAHRDHDRILRAWLDLMPDEAPDRTIATVLQAIETTRQRRGLRWPVWRPTPMKSTLAALGAASIVIAAGSVLIARSSGPSVGATPTIATVTASAGSAGSAAPSAAAAANQPLPRALQARWMGGNTEFVPPGAGTSIKLDADRLAMTASNSNNVVLLAATVSAPSPGVIEVTGSGEQDCRATDLGVYSWTQSPSGLTLTTRLVADDCAGRGRALAGTWYRMACRDASANCLGPLDAGTYASQFVGPKLGPGETWTPQFGALKYTVPDGWANYADWPGWIGLTPVADFDRTTSSQVDPGVGIIVDGQVSAETHDVPCSGKADSIVPSTPSAILDSIRRVRGLIVGPATAITIGGRPGLRVDLQVDAGKIEPCGTEHAVEYMIAAGEGHTIGTNERRQLVLLDLGEGHVVAIEIQSIDPARFEAFAVEAMPIVESLRFK
jgi:hypothetical protein